MTTTAPPLSRPASTPAREHLGALPGSLLACPVFSVADAARFGVCERALRAAVVAGAVERVTRGWYRAALDLSDLARYRARGEAARPERGLPLSHVSALVAHDLPVWAPGARPVYLVGRVDQRRRRRGVVVAGPLADGTRLDPCGTTVDLVEALQTTALVDPELALAGMDHACRAGRTTPGALVDAVARARNRAGADGARRAVAFVDPRRESVGESRLAWRCQGWGLDLESQVTFALPTGTARVDFLVRGTNVVLGLDGRIEDASQDELFAEKRREDQLRRLGLVVVRVVWADLYRPDELRARILAAIAGMPPLGGRLLPPMAAGRDDVG